MFTSPTNLIPASQGDASEDDVPACRTADCLLRVPGRLWLSMIHQSFGLAKPSFPVLLYHTHLTCYLQWAGLVFHVTSAIISEYLIREENHDYEHRAGMDPTYYSYSDNAERP